MAIITQRASACIACLTGVYHGLAIWPVD